MKKERNTYQKNLIRETVLNLKTHPSADEIFEIVRESCPTISRATVYRVLNDLAEKGEVYRVRVANGSDRYDSTLCDHCHVKCNDCGKVSDVDVPGIEEIEDHVENSQGYLITGHSILFEGVCPECVKK